jgi:hypothetical protein
VPPAGAGPCGATVNAAKFEENDAYKHSEDYQTGKEFGSTHAMAIVCSLAVFFIFTSFGLASYRRARRARNVGAAESAIPFDVESEDRRESASRELLPAPLD